MLLTTLLAPSFPVLLRNTILALEAKGWNISKTNDKRGYCKYMSKELTIPVHAFRHSDKGYLVYYIAHEVSHAVVGHTVQSHGPEFMSEFKRLCPIEYQHYEIGYKPRNAIAAGIMPVDF